MIMHPVAYFKLRKRIDIADNVLWPLGSLRDIPLVLRSINDIYFYRCANWRAAIALCMLHNMEQLVLELDAIHAEHGEKA